MIKSKATWIVLTVIALSVVGIFYYASRVMHTNGSVAQSVPLAKLVLPAKVETAASAAVGVEPASVPALDLLPRPIAAEAATSSPGVTGASASAISEASQRRQMALQSALSQFQDMLQHGQRDPVQTAAALEELERANGSSVLGGVDLGVLRRNLQIAGQMQQIAQQMQSLEPTSGASAADAQSQALLKEKQAQLQALSQQLRAEVMVAGTAPTVPQQAQK